MPSLASLLVMAAAIVIQKDAQSTPIESKIFHPKNEVYSQIITEINNETFYFTDTPLTWYDAIGHCESLDMQLITFDSEERWDMISAWLIENSEYNWYTWTSGHKLAGQEEFVWTTTGQTFNFTAWEENEPSQEVSDIACVNFYTSYGWDDNPCTGYYQVICETKTAMSP